MRSLLTLARCVAPLFLAGCGVAITFHPTMHFARAPRDPATVGVYTLQPTPHPYTVVGYLRAEQQALDVEPGTEMLAQLRMRAAVVGCDAIVIDHGHCVEETGSRVRSMTVSTLEAACVVETP